MTGTADAELTAGGSTTARAAQLETGWLPGTAVGDTILRRFLYNQAEHNEALAIAAGGRCERRADVFLADAATPVAFLNQAILARPLFAVTDPVLDAVEAFYAGGRASLLSLWPTPDLSARGWSLVGHPVMVVRAPGPIPPWRARDVDVRVVASTEDLTVAERVAIEGFPLDEARGAPPGAVLPATLVNSGVAVRLAYLQGRAAGVGIALVGHGVVNLVLGTTLPDARRRGVWESVVWARVASAPSLPAVAYTSDDSRPGFERMGFLPIQRLTLWHR